MESERLLEDENEATPLNNNNNNNNNNIHRRIRTTVLLFNAFGIVSNTTVVTMNCNDKSTNGSIVMRIIR